MQDYKKQNEVNKMGYNAKTAKESALLPPDTILDGVIIAIKDGKVKDFVTNTEKWQGDVEQTAINIVVEVKNGDESVTIEQVFTYNVRNEVTTFAPSSNMAKYNKKYGKLPEAGDKVKIQTKSDGFGKVKLD